MMSEEIEKCLSGVKPVLRRNQLKRRIKKLLRDPLLWLSLKYSDVALTEAFGSMRRSLTDGNVVNEWRDMRENLCNSSLRGTADNGETQAQKLKIVSETKDRPITDDELRNVLFPHLPTEALCLEVTESEGASESDSVLVPQESACANPQRAVVTDLYKCPESNSWEGYIVSTEEGAVYRFTSTSCNCTFPVCLGSIVEFTKTVNSVACGTLKVVQYFPGSLHDGYAAQYLQQLESTLEVPDRISKIIKLPGPFASILNEKRLYSARQSKILAILNSISNDQSGHFRNVILLLGLHSSQFIQCLPQCLLNENQSLARTRDGECTEVVHFLRLVAILVGFYPKIAYSMSSVLQDCTRLVPSFEREFTIEASNLCQAIIHACSKVRREERIRPSSEGCSFSYSDEVCTTPVNDLLDPLLWVKAFFGEPITKSLRNFIPRKSLCDSESIVTARRQVENIIQSEDFKAKKHDTFSGDFPIVQRMSLQHCRKDSRLALKKGIITDIYRNGVGYIALALGEGYGSRRLLNQRVFRIEESTTSIVVTPQAIHIGDVVTFQVSAASPGTVYKIVWVNQYCSESLDESFAQDFFSSHVGLEKLLSNEAAMRGILNASKAYRSTLACNELISAATEAMSDSTASIKNRMLSLLKSSSFIGDLIDITPQQVSKSVEILKHYLSQFPNEVCVLAPVLNTAMAHLLAQDKPNEVASFMYFLSTSICLLPPAIEIEMQPWRSIPIILTKDEWKTGAIANKDYLPVVKDRGFYSSINEYGRTYFLLLRADCLGGLASTIFRLREPTSSSAKNGSEFEIPVCDATFKGLSSGGTGHRLAYHFNMETRPLPAERLSPDTPLFKHGNLLCFSVGGRFEGDIIWATVDHISRFVHPAKTDEGLIIKSSEILVQFCTESNLLSDEEAMQRLKASENVVALESPAYFKAYQPVLDVLKRMDLEKIHFITDLINPGPKPQASLQLINDTMIVTDLGGLYKGGATNMPGEMTVGELRDKLTGEQVEEFCLHHFQRIAMDRALSQALSLIQGPPGTGKSYMGIQLLRLFLSMKDSSGMFILHNRPALVMAYKNRALDHFILLCQQFCPLHDIVRIGHISKDNEDTLKPILLREKVMTALSRPRTVELRDTMRNQFERVRAARMELEAIPKLQDLDDCLDVLTPEWLRSLMLDGDIVVEAREVTEAVEADPNECLKLLQSQQLGKSDRVQKQTIERAVKKAWDTWVDGATHYEIITHDKYKTQLQEATMPDDSDDENNLVIDYEDWENENNEVEAFSHSFCDDLEKGAAVVHEVSNVWELSGDDRRHLITASLKCQYDIAMEELKESMKQYNITRDIYEKRYERKALEILRGAKIVAVTTTGAAIHQRLLNQLETPVMFVEEAAEILESNLLAVLTPHVKHMVLIGDHKQLKPNLAWNRLEKHKFNLSLFERLIRNGYLCTLLLRQHRMHPTLVSLFDYHYKQKIHSTEKTESLEKPECMGKNFFWWSYEGKYESVRESSKYNPHEVEMVVSLCCWLVCNKVQSTSITVLTPYRCQLEEIQKSLRDIANKHKKMPSDMVNIQVYTVDEYQGHESDVVILSLVRSNSIGKIGFLSRHNRLVVGTSRQKNALYIVGNCTFLEKSSPMLWKEFITQCRSRDHKSIHCNLPIVVGSGLEFCQSASELEERVMKVLEVASNNIEPIASLDETDSDTDPFTAASGSADSTPVSIRSRSVSGTPGSVRSGSAVSTPGSVRSLSLSATPPAPILSPAAFSVSDHDPPTSVERTAHTSRSAARQQSSPALFAHQSNTTEDTPDSAVSSSTRTWDFKKTVLTLKDTEAAKEWKFIGRRLGLEDSEISALERSHGTDIKELFYQMMTKWRETEGERATEEELIRALKAENLKRVVELLEK